MQAHKSHFRRALVSIQILLVAVILGISVGSGVVAAQEASPVTTDTTTSPTTQSSAGGGTGASVADNVCKGVMSAETGAFDANTTIRSCYENGDNSFGFLVKKIINIFSIVVGAVSVIMIIIGGFRYVISGGDSSGVSNAKNTILYAIVGLVIVLFAQVIIRFVLTNIAART